jgi:hypothetical protein
VVLVEDASRFARDLMAQELGLGVLIKLGMKVLTANGDDKGSRSGGMPSKPALRLSPAPGNRVIGWAGG